VLGALLAFLVGDVLRVRRAHVEGAMRRAGVSDPGRVARAMYRSLGRGLVELVRATFGDSARVFSRVEVPASTIAELRGAGGAVIATAHTGNWDVVACAIAARAPLTVVTKRFSVGGLDRLWQRARADRGVRLVGVGDAVRGARAAFRERGLVAMLVDQAPERRRAVVRTTFLGAPVWVDLSPALVARRFRAPLVAAFPVRRDDGSLAVEIVRTIAPPRRPDRRWAERTMVEVTACLDAFVREHPEQWLWMHRRWKALPDETTAPAELPLEPCSPDALEVSRAP
jgi:KDO2-lipid IV(A) lauroyltransferase